MHKVTLAIGWSRWDNSSAVFICMYTPSVNDHYGILIITKLNSTNIQNSIKLYMRTWRAERLALANGCLGRDAK
ncbi:hypothetical protein XELAEV_18031887mg [Xenopus laevis]|uniref:Uncharacterized protein n=1 Tax=Xenopus laevis TaxID=8355 RepID=A0A974CQ34_XENLA|nr:hypothetical protein XELAEV_18031887mg [Xenopus laevis]